MKLSIAKEISFPLDAVTQTLAAIGRKGAGKTYLATMLAEQMLDAAAQVVAIDPVGNWWGLRVGADGKTKGKEIFVIGGEHGDVPLVPEAGARIAKLIVEKGVSAVLDISGFRLGERKRFCADFGEELLHLKKKQRTPVHLFIEEAQLIIPQRVGPEEARMVGAFEQIVRLGRNYGIGCTLITQRPQSVNKEVLSQVECLCVLQVTGPHERKALEDWVQEVGADRTLIGELPGLARGEGYVWSPSWLRVYRRVHFAKKTTFDASATPEVGRATKAAKLSAVDVEALKSDIADVVAKAEKDNPVALRKKIADLERDLKSAEKFALLKTGGAVIKERRVEVPVLKDAQITRLEKVFGAMVKEAERHGAAMGLLWGNFNEVGKALLAALDTMRKVPVPILPSKPPPRSIQPVIATQPAVDGAFVPSSSQQKILSALAWLESIGVDLANKTQLAFLADQSPTSSGYSNNLGALRTAGLIAYPQPGTVSLTDAGRSIAGVPDGPTTTRDLHEQVRAKVSGSEWRILSALIDAYPNSVSKTELAERANQSVTSSGYSNNLGSLRSLGLIDYPSAGMVVAKPILFLDQ